MSVKDYLKNVKRMMNDLTYIPIKTYYYIKPAMI